ncbi:hypothetical protein B591_30368 (plasmid) [Streptomyces sp. GBA 94-10 4N24]|uniref:hypothetical protein n=1 Tax=Actinomycetes TaxID=1760 RepID=UPI0003C32D78|nr:hypothetical protein [Streptomyces sp. GBA 94-10 4N24]ESP95593.1 hypothetical protein B591_30368 [Streptomyces sp. GBA 94-10 4N24]UZN63055.1 hypothetical protein B591N_30368 [Streptomyces sp. GBA 94-10 4N24]
MTHIIESVRSITEPTLTEGQKDRLTRTMPVAFTPAVLVTTPYAGGGLAAGAAVVGAYELGRAAGGK